MSNERESQPFIVRFFDGFFQEQNIKWMLSVGLLLLLGSSLRLVSVHWMEYTPTWKYLILLLYSAAIFAASQFSYFRMGLKRTGTVLMALTVLLVPVTFLALHWVRPRGELQAIDFSRHLGLMAMLSLNFVLSTLATHHIFVHFLRKPQPTFQIAFLGLSLAGALFPGLPEWTAPLAALAIWMLFTIGTVKVNRHVFWLIEEHRQPRIFGFFPIALLGLQFLGLFGFCLRENIPTQWWGLGCALVAVPVLMTADTVAKVFQLRTGNLIRPFPISIIGPLVVGCLLCLSGLCLTLTGLPTPHAMVPTAALCAIAMAIVAQRTQHQTFVWASLICVLLAYQFSPVFFLEFAKNLIQSSASAVQESKLPYAFYGLTYLPILILFTTASVVLQRAGNTLFSIPLRHAASSLSCLLLVVALGHPKAMFPVATALGILILAQSIAFKSTRLLVVANFALTEAVYGLLPFFTATGLTTESTGSQRHHLVLLALLQLIPGRLLEQGLQRWIQPAQSKMTTESCRPLQISSLFSLVITLAISVMSIASVIHGSPINTELPFALTLAGLLLTHSLIWMRPALSVASVVFVNLTALSFSVAFIPALQQPEAYGLFMTLILLAQWFGAAILKRFPENRFSKCFAQPMQMLSLIPLAGLALLSLGMLLFLHLNPTSIGPAFWMSSMLLILWCYSAANRLNCSQYAIVGFVNSLAISSAMLSLWAGADFGNRLYPVAWASTCVLTLGLLQLNKIRLCKNQSTSEDASGQPALPAAQPAAFRPVTMLAEICLTLLAGFTLFGLTPESRIAGLIALAGLWSRPVGAPPALRRSDLIVLGIWHSLLVMINIMTPGHQTILTVTLAEWRLLSLPVALFAAANVLVLEGLFLSRPSLNITSFQIHRAISGIVAAVALVPLFILRNHPLPIPEVLLLGMTFNSLIASQWLRAIRTQQTSGVWAGLVLLAARAFTLYDLRGYSLSAGSGMYLMLAASLLLLTLGKYSRKHTRFDIFSQPFKAVGFWLPLAAVALGCVRFLSGESMVWMGSNSLALLIAAAIYFFQGLEQHRKARWALAAIILNLSLAMLWGELQWHDAQLFMIPMGLTVLILTELLAMEIPKTYHDPLRYLGSLTILVSPTFEIAGGSWLHLLTLMISAIIIILLAIGFRLRALIYTGTAFLIADMIAIVVRRSLDQPNLLWGSGVILGFGVIALAAYCERHREHLLSRIRLLSAELETWK